MRHSLAIVIAIVCILILSCQDQHKQTIENGSEQLNTDSINKLKLKLQGRWGGLTEKNPVWLIKGDSIQYIQENSTYYYKLKGDTFYVKFPERDTFTAFGKIRVTNDTFYLTQYDENNFEIWGYRFK